MTSEMLDELQQAIEASEVALGSAGSYGYDGRLLKTILENQMLLFSLFIREAKENG